MAATFPALPTELHRTHWQANAGKIAKFYKGNKMGAALDEANTAHDKLAAAIQQIRKVADGNLETEKDMISTPIMTLDHKLDAVILECRALIKVLQSAILPTKESRLFVERILSQAQGFKKTVGDGSQYFG